jgi:hypothetical protein
VILITGHGVAHAQHPVHRQGLGGGQAMDGALPFEQVDPLSGNLVVTATDLVLRGMPASTSASSGSTTAASTRGMRPVT